MASWNLCTDRQIQTTCCCACWSSMKCEFADCSSRSKRLYLSVPELQLWVLLSPRSTCIRIGNTGSVIACYWNWTLARQRCCLPKNTWISVISGLDSRWAGTRLKQQTSYLRVLLDSQLLMDLQEETKARGSLLSFDWCAGGSPTLSGTSWCQ